MIHARVDLNKNHRCRFASRSWPGAGQHMVSLQSDQEFATSVGLPFYEISSKTGENVDEAFKAIALYLAKPRNAELLPEDAATEDAKSVLT